MRGFSYSAIKKFEQCPKQYYHTRVANDVQDEPGEAALYGTDLHKAAEDNTNEGKPIPKRFGYILGAMETLDRIPGDHYAEIKLGIKRDGPKFVACDFDDPDFWWHGIADRLVVNGWKAHCVDYKTGKNSRYADMRQLDLLAAGVMALFPAVMKVKSALLYTDAKDLISKTHIRTEMSRYLSVFNMQLMQLETAHASGVWNAKPSGLCPWCPVKQCEHWSPRRN